MRKAICLIAAVMLGFIAVPSAQASVAIGNNCSVSATSPWTDGSNIYSTGRLRCSTYGGVSGPADARAVEIISVQQRKGTLTFSDQGKGVAKHSSGSLDLSVTGKYYCNGDGKKSWRGKATGKTSKLVTRQHISTERSLTC